MPSLQRFISSKGLAWSLLLTACVGEQLPTEIDLGQPSRPSPGTPGPSPTSPPAPLPRADNRRSFVWTKDGGFTIIENPPGVILVGAQSINDRGEVAGTVIMDASAGLPIYRGFKWSAANGFTLFSAQGELDTYVKAIDDYGRVLGYTEGPNTPYGRERRAFMWSESDGLQPLGLFMPFLNVLGVDPGVIFGNALTGGKVAPFRLRISGGHPEFLATTGDVGGGVMDMNDRGEAVGYEGDLNYGFGGTSDAVIWDPIGNRDVAYDCKGQWNCFAYLSAINSSGTAVGSITEGEYGDTRVFRWSRSNGLEYLEVPESDRYSSAVAGINDDGSILALNRRDGFILESSGTILLIRALPPHSIARPLAMNRVGQVVGMLF